jgi:hypothetical protein
MMINLPLTSTKYGSITPKRRAGRKKFGVKPMEVKGESYGTNAQPLGR